MLEVGWWGSLRDLFKNILKQGVGKGKSCSKGGGDLKVSQSLPPGNFNHTLTEQSTIFYVLAVLEHSQKHNDVIACTVL